VLEQVGGMRAQSEALGVRLRAALEDMATRVDAIGEVRGLGPMLALEIVRDRETKIPAPDVVGAAVAAARKEGLLLLACGLYSNVIRLLPPLTISDADLTRGLEILEASLV
jgi:4-aminobutyrate aminotransferase-like enzyme